MRWAILVVALVLVLAGSVYGYLWYQLGQIKSVRCATCAVEVPGAPYNVLIVGSDSRAGDTGGAAKAFGSASQVGGQRSDTIKILHVNPSAGTAEILSIPRDTYVTLSGMPSGTGLATDNKINTAFNSGQDPLIQTIENTFGIPINHFVITSFNGVIDLVQAVGGITLDFPYPVRDNDQGNNNSGLEHHPRGLPDPERQHGPGPVALALLRVRGPPRLLGVRRQRRPGTYPAPERRHRSRDRQGGLVELQPCEGQRLSRFHRATTSPRTTPCRRPC